MTINDMPRTSLGRNIGTSLAGHWFTASWVLQDPFVRNRYEDTGHGVTDGPCE